LKSVKRKGQNFNQTPMGYILQRRRLHENHIFFQEVTEQPQLAAPASHSQPIQESDSEDDPDYNEDVYYDTVGELSEATHNTRSD
jgi:hypothetical protein